MRSKRIAQTLLMLVLMGGLGFAVYRSTATLRPSPAAQPARRAANYIVTVKPLEFILREVCGERASVATLLKAGSNAHTYDPTPADAEAVQTATALVWVGRDYDGWAAELNTRQSLELLPLVPREKLLTLAEACNHDHGHGHVHHTHEVDDPHFFTDPQTVKALLPGLAAELTRLDPEGAAQYESGAAAFATRLDALDAELAQTLAPVAGRSVIQFHASFNYFIVRYGLLNAGVIEEFPGKEPTPKYLEEVVKQLRLAGVKAIFSETLLPQAPAQVIGEAADVPVFELDPSCGTSERAYPDYAAWLRHNAGVFVEALGSSK